jgi:hypothetical protein
MRVKTGRVTTFQIIRPCLDNCRIKIELAQGAAICYKCPAPCMHFSAKLERAPDIRACRWWVRFLLCLAVIMFTCKKSLFRIVVKHTKPYSLPMFVNVKECQSWHTSAHLHGFAEYADAGCGRRPGCAFCRPFAFYLSLNRTSIVLFVFPGGIHVHWWYNII